MGVAVALACLLSWPLGVKSASASDGVLEINQTCAVQTGCFAGDAAGFPVTIDGIAGRSYRLTSDLALPTENTTGVDIQASFISLDLNGFAVRGPTVCNVVGDPLETVCSPVGTGIGVSNLGPFSGVRVRNGIVTGAGSLGIAIAFVGDLSDVITMSNGSHGIFLGTGSRTSRCQTIQNGGHGIEGQANVTIRDCTAQANGSRGFSLGDNGSIQHSRAAANLGIGMVLGEGSAASENTSYQNELEGILASSGSTISGNTTYQNGQTGIFGSGSGLTIANNTSYNNGRGTNPSAGDGIHCAGGCLVRANSVRANTGAGLTLLIGSAYGGNVITNNGASVIGSGSTNNLGSNHCSGTGAISPTCP